MNDFGYDPFRDGRFAVGVRTRTAPDRNRERQFPVEIWYPARAEPAAGLTAADPRREATPDEGTHPLIVFSHHAGGNRLSAAYVCTHLASHGYVVAAMDHSEVVASDLALKEGETATARAARVEHIIASRVPDVRFLLDYLLSAGGDTGTADLGLDEERIGLVGHSFGGWTVLATADIERRIRSVVALGPGGNRHPMPGVLTLTLSFARHHDIPTLYLAAENDTPIPLAGVRELFDRTPGSKRMFILRRADHQHFLNDVEGEHEAIRAMSLPGAAAWIPNAMRPIAELATGEQAHLFVRGLTLAHLDATLQHLSPATRLLSGDVESELAAHGVDAIAHPPPNTVSQLERA